MKICNKFLLLISVFIFVFLFSFSSFAITPYSSLQPITFSEGPWSGCGYARVRYNSDGSISHYDSAPKWKGGTSLGDSFYSAVGISLNSSGYEDIYLFSGNRSNFILFANEPLTELYAVDPHGNIISSILDEAFICEYDGEYFYGASALSGCGIAFRTETIVNFSEFSTALYGGSYYVAVMNALPFLSGIYDGNSLAIKYPGLNFSSWQPLTLDFGYRHQVFPVVIDTGATANALTNWVFYSSEGVLHEGSKYTFSFKVKNVKSGRIYIGDSSVYNSADVVNDVLTLTIDGQETSLSSLGVGFVRSSASSPKGIVFCYLSSSSSDIGTLPPDSGGGDGSGSPDYTSALAAIDKSLESVMAAVSGGATQVVNNITYQTTQITNTITNTVTNMTQQITQGLQSVQQGITDKLGTVQDGITNKLQDVQQGVTDKLQNVQDGINDKLGEVQDEIVNGYDNSGINQDAAELDQSLQEYEEAEKTVIDQVNGSLNDFEFDSGFDEYTNTIKVFSDFIQALYEASGGFKVVINLSLMLSIAGIVIGVYRFRDGG